MNHQRDIHRLLKQLKANGGKLKRLKSMTFGDKDQLHRMMIAGLVTFDLQEQEYIMTDAGDAVLSFWEARDAAREQA